MARTAFYDANGNRLSVAGRTFTYTNFNKPATIMRASGITTLSYDAAFTRMV